MLKLQTSPNVLGINVPTKSSEITPEYLSAMTNHVELAENYAIVALIVGVKLTDFCFTIASPSGNKNTQYKVTSVVAKVNPQKDVKTKFNVGDIAFISNTDIERGLHLSGIPSCITSDFVSSYLLQNEQLRKSIVTGEAKIGDKRMGDEMIYMLQFKIVPIFDIHAVIDLNAKRGQDTFVIMPEKENKQ